jgi:alpha-tubulin suppressor-like RCC1 family protein
LVGGGFALTAATAGYRHVIGITTGGTLVGWGLNVDGEVGSGAPLTSFQAPVALTWNPAATPVTAVSAGSYYSMALKTATGEVASWGSNGGQFGDGTTAPRLAPSLTTANAKAIAAGKFHSLFINGDDYLEAAGYNAKGQLGNGGTTDYPYRGPLLEPLQ